MSQQPPLLSLKPRFATPFLEAKMPNWQTLNPRLRELFIRWEQDSGRKRSNIPTGVMKLQVYESDFDLFQNPEPEIQLLAKFCLQLVGHVISELNGYSADIMSRLRIYQHSWYHVTRDRGYTGNHNHPMASWSGVYCVDPGEVNSGKHENGLLKFLDSRTACNMYLDPGNSHFKEPYGFGDIVYSLEPGQLVIFPSYIFHEVTPYYGLKERITVAFNAWTRYADQAVDEPMVRT